MPGTVRKINVAPGDHFEAHQPLVVMESMKMEMSLSMPHPGTVAQLSCEVGQLVDMGAVLLRVAP
jgi:biotin carboxyl carrier protein